MTTSIRAATALRLAFGGDPDALHVGVAALPGARIAISVGRRGVVEARELLDETSLGAGPTLRVPPVAEMFEAARAALARARR